MYYNSNVSPLTSGDAIVTGVLAFFTWYINLSQMVPISLIVSGEMVKFIMSIFINMDVFLYHAPIHKQAHCNSSTIHEDLGLIDYVFSDKTGTLTQNKMEFRYALVSGGAEYGSRETEIAKAVQQRNAELVEREAGTYKPKPMPRWTELLRPFVPRRMEDPVTHYDEDCCTKSCPRWCHGCWINKKPVNDTINAYMPDEDAQSPRPADSNSNAPALAPEVNCFTSAERRVLLNALYGPAPAGMSAEEHASRRDALHLYMLHMTLSNTVKPFMEDGVLQFQPESAEELAMVQFAHSCGYTKLPEKEEKDKTPEERASGASTRVAIQRYDSSLQPQGEPEIHAYAFLACLGFTSARARVTVIYQEASSKNILVMMKGQDTTVLPFLHVAEQRGAKLEESLLANLTDCCNNGLRTLVAGHASCPASWWDTWGPEYAKVRDMSDEDEKLKQRMEHELFERIEHDAKPQYCGCLGMEDQLQPLVPDCIQACLRANVKVWMITGDKLETARNIGLACNLIDADMQPQIKAGHSLSEAMAAYADSRLIHVTGEWNDIFDNTEELQALFSAIDYNKDGFVSVSEMSMMLTSLHNGIREDRIRMVMDQLFDQVARGGPLVSGTNNVTPTSTSQAPGERPVSSQSTRERGVDKEGFMIVMRQFKRTPYEAVVYDVEEGLRRYKRIRDHEAYPVSVLVNRDAFLVMFPGKPISPARASVATDTRTSRVLPGDDLDSAAPTEQQLEVLRRKFFFLASVSKSVIFARAQPAMKKRMVTEIQARVPAAITLAIGDGANDTDMITAAHVGVGISGVEGTAATNSADYAIGTFRMLHTLLFVHGYWSYARVGALVNFIFYKASLLAITQFLFGFYSGFSGQQFFNDPIYQLYNVMFTALPIISLAVLDKPLPKNTCEDNPAAFREQKYRVFNPAVFASWMFRAVLHSCIAFFIPLYALDDVSPSTGGHTVDLWYFSTIVFFAVALVPTFLIFFVMQSIQLFHVIAVVLSVAGIILVSYIVNTPLFSFINPDLTDTIDLQFQSASYWLTLVLAVAVPLLLELIYRFVQRQFSPSFTQVLQEKLAISRHAEKTINKSSASAAAPSKSLQGAPDVELDVLNSDYIRVPRPIITPEEEAMWQRQSRRDEDEAPLASVLRGVAEPHDDQDEEQLRSALVRAMLRFRSHTGSQFDSAAQAQYQSHDSFASPAFGNVPGSKDTVDGVPIAKINTLRKRNRPERVRTSSRPRTASASRPRTASASRTPQSTSPSPAPDARRGSRTRSYSRAESVSVLAGVASTDALLSPAPNNSNDAVATAPSFGAPVTPSSRANTPKRDVKDDASPPM
jgi:magnesium-transporting ATPase (P-type)